MTEGILAGFRLIEGSAFVAAPLGGMTLAQLGADVIRFDQIGGGLAPPAGSRGVPSAWGGARGGRRIRAHPPPAQRESRRLARGHQRAPSARA